MSRTAHECFFIGCDELAAAATAALSGDRELADALVGVFEWIREMAGRAPGDRMACLDCDAEFSRDLPPGGVVVVRPMFEADTSLIAGLCPRCWAGDVNAVIVRRLRPVMPDIEIVPIGNA